MSRFSVGALCATLLVTLNGCSIFGRHGVAPHAPVVTTTDQTTALRAHLDALQHLVQGQPADQATLLADAKRDFETAPSPQHQLRYALLLATPGHVGANPNHAEQLLHPLVTLPPGTLAPGEQALAIVQLQNVQRIRFLATDNQRLQNLVERGERDRAVANTRRLQQEIDENAKLRKDLEEARTKLDAIANIERGLTHPNP